MKFGLSVPQFEDFGDVKSPLSPDDWIDVTASINTYRKQDEDYDFVHYGVTPGDDLLRAAALVAPYQEIGVTWWVEGISPYDLGFDWGDLWTPEIVEKLERRVRQGPPDLLG